MPDVVLLILLRTTGMLNFQVTATLANGAMTIFGLQADSQPDAVLAAICRLDSFAGVAESVLVEQLVPAAVR